MVRATSVFLLWAISSVALWAAPAAYDVDKSQSNIGFTYKFGADTVKGQFGDYEIDLVIDFDAVANSKVNVTIDTRKATAGFAFATQAIRSQKILDVKKFPQITFVSNKITGGGNEAKINGIITVKGISKPLTLNAKIYRSAGTSAGDRSDLKLKITGTIDRNDFGADGFQKEVAPKLNILIDARVLRK